MITVAAAICATRRQGTFPMVSRSAIPGVKRWDGVRGYGRRSRLPGVAGSDHVQQAVPERQRRPSARAPIRGDGAAGEVDNDALRPCARVSEHDEQLAAVVHRAVVDGVVLRLRERVEDM